MDSGLSDEIPVPDGTVQDWTGDPQPMVVESSPEIEEAKSLTDVAKEVLKGEWGRGQEKRIALANAGYDPNKVDDEVVRLVNTKP